MACHHGLWKMHMVARRWAWHAISSVGQNKWSDNVRRGIQSFPLDITYGRTMSGVACHHCLWAKHMVRLRWVLQEIIYLGQHIQLKNVERFMLSLSLDFTHSRTTSGMACPHVPWAENTVRRHRARHSIIALEQHTRLATSCIACYH